jgi:hypothetical protein
MRLVPKESVSAGDDSDRSLTGNALATAAHAAAANTTRNIFGRQVLFSSKYLY